MVKWGSNARPKDKIHFLVVTQSCNSESLEHDE